MDALKAEFNRLIEIMGWTQTEAARHLAKTPSAINHLMNPHHPNKPTPTTLRLLKLIMARERPELFTARTFELKGSRGRAEGAPLSARERDLVRRLRELPRGEQEKVYAVIGTLLDNVPRSKRAKTTTASSAVRSVPRG